MRRREPVSRLWRGNDSNSSPQYRPSDESNRPTMAISLLVYRLRVGGERSLFDRAMRQARLNGSRQTAFRRFGRARKVESAMLNRMKQWLLATALRHRAGPALLDRTLDVVFAAILLALASPLMLLVALAIRLDSRGPAILRQTRVGLNGEPFEMFKFRSMRSDAEADGVARWAEERDPRITRIGRFLRLTRIDELPQLVNVLRGDMRIVGPRPERPEFVRILAAEIPTYERRHAVKPGITGWAQVQFPYAASTAQSARKLEYDLFYINNRGLLLDLRILIETIGVVALASGAR